MDWSSDVCSSDLWQRLQRKRRVKVITLYLRHSGAAAAAIALLVAASMFLWNTSETENPPVAVQNQEQLPNAQQIPGDKTIVEQTSVSGERSEERHVGRKMVTTGKIVVSAY